METDQIAEFVCPRCDERMMVFGPAANGDLLVQCRDCQIEGWRRPARIDGKG